MPLASVALEQAELEETQVVPSSQMHWTPVLLEVLEVLEVPPELPPLEPPSMQAASEAVITIAAVNIDMARKRFMVAPVIERCTGPRARQHAAMIRRDPTHRSWNRGSWIGIERLASLRNPRGVPTKRKNRAEPLCRDGRPPRDSGVGNVMPVPTVGPVLARARKPIVFSSNWRKLPCL